MCNIRLAVLLITVISAVCCVPTGEKDIKPKSCFVPSLNKYIEPDTRIPHPNTCLDIICTKEGVLTEMSCGLIYVRPECKLIPPNDSIPYPDCCAKEDCTKH